MILQFLILCLGLGLLITGATWLVNGASKMAWKYKVSDLTIGLTIVAFGTSAPELVVNTLASLEGHQDIVFGNVIGSNNFNLFLILGVVGSISPLVVQSSTVWKEIPLSFFAALLLFGLCNEFLTGTNLSLSRLDGIILLVCFGLFMSYIYTQLKAEPGNHEVEHKPMAGWKITALILLGLGGLVFGGKLVMESAILLATSFGVSEKIIGQTIVAAGTSLPELATSVMAVIKKNNNIAVGNVIGSNIFNILLILAISTTINPIVYDPLFNADLYMLLAGTLFLFIAMFTGKKKSLDRWEAGILFASYIIYTIYLLK